MRRRRGCRVRWVWAERFRFGGEGFGGEDEHAVGCEKSMVCWLIPASALMVSDGDGEQNLKKDERAGRCHGNTGSCSKVAARCTPLLGGGKAYGGRSLNSSRRRAQ